MNTTGTISRGTFFSKIGIADMERVHSAVIGWMLSDECVAFDISTRSKLLNALYGYDTGRRFTKIESFIEWKDIDILLLTEDSEGKKDCWIVENKIKTSQHSNQLVKYNKIIDNDYPNYQKHFAYLTLIGETVLGDSGNWMNVTYHQLVRLLEENEQELKDNPDAVILREYYFTIKQLDDAAMRFIAAPQDYANVFTDGCKSKEAKYEQANKNKYKDDTGKFIGMNNLETIFQKMYFAQVLKEILHGSHIKHKSWHVGETRGNADFAIHFYNYPNPEKENDFHFDISFQAGTFKFAISRSYWSDTSKKNIESVLAWKEDFMELQKAFPEYSRFNKAKSRARISISKNLKGQYEEWYLMNRDTFTQIVKDEFEIADKMRQCVIGIHEKRIAGKEIL